jgi:anti-sigma factor RsiW
MLMHPSETALNDYIDGALDARERAGVEQHLESCAECRRTVDDLGDIRRAAAGLELREPPVRAWTRIERAIKLEAELRPSTQRPQHSQRNIALRARQALRSTSGKVWLAAAAVLALATVVGLRVMPGRDRAIGPAATSPGASTSAATSTAAAQSVETELRQAEDHYEKAIKGLEQIANAEQNVFDPRTAATLQKNLAVIDQAISESRAALRSEPASEPAQQSLMDNFKTKMALLQDTVALINEMRKGNDAGAARIVSGLKQKGD